jgi:hypothetical protein
VFSDKPLENEAVFEIRIDKMDTKWTGSLSIGVTSHVPPTHAPAEVGELRNNTVFLSGSSVFKDGVKVRGCSVFLDRLQVCGNRQIGLTIAYDLVLPPPFYLFLLLHVHTISTFSEMYTTTCPSDLFIP